MPPIPKLPFPMLVGGAVTGMLGAAVVMAIIAGVVGDIPVIKLVAYTLIGVIGAMVAAAVVGGLVLAVLWPPVNIFWTITNKMISKKKS